MGNEKGRSPSFSCITPTSKEGKDTRTQKPFHLAKLPAGHTLTAAARRIFIHEGSTHSETLDQGGPPRHRMRGNDDARPLPHAGGGHRARLHARHAAIYGPEDLAYHHPARRLRGRER